MHIAFFKSNTHFIIKIPKIVLNYIEEIRNIALHTSGTHNTIVEEVNILKNKTYPPARRCKTTT